MYDKRGDSTEEVITVTEEEEKSLMWNEVDGVKQEARCRDNVKHA